MYNDDEIIELFKEALSEVDASVDTSKVTIHSRITDIGLDSIIMMEVIGAIEERIDQIFPDEKLTGLQTMSDLRQLILETC